MELTPRQNQVLEFLREHMERTGMPPTRAEIALALGFRSANAAEQHLRALARKGAIRLVPGASRGICLNPNAGIPWLSDHESEPGQPLSNLTIDPCLFSPSADLALIYRGPALRSLGILPGDSLLVHRTELPEDGQLVLVRINGQGLVKRYKQKGARAYLMSDSTDTATFVVSGREDVVILGNIVGILRRYGDESGKGH